MVCDGLGWRHGVTDLVAVAPRAHDAVDDVPHWITGAHDGVAVRVSAHPVVVALCAAFGGPLVSTSANRGGEDPARGGT